MALSGNLKDFDISYIVQIIAQESKTGRLILSTEEMEAFVIFKQGRIVSAGTNRKNIQGMLFNYLTKIRKIPRDEITELRAQHHSDLKRFSEELCLRQMITPQELSHIVQSGVEDITCSLFSLRDGSYKFNMLQSADSFEVGNCSIAPDMIMMEAARRSDEFGKFGELFTRNTIFIHSEAPDFTQPLAINPLTQFREYLFHQIDGASSVDLLCQNAFLSDFQVYQSLLELVHERRIATLPDSISNSINSAIRRSHDNGTTILIKSALSAAAALACALTLYSSGIFVLPALENQLFKNSSERLLPLREQITATKITAARLLFQAEKCKRPIHDAELVTASILSRQDIRRALFVSGN